MKPFAASTPIFGASPDVRNPPPSRVPLSSLFAWTAVVVVVMLLMVAVLIVVPLICHRRRSHRRQQRQKEVPLIWRRRWMPMLLIAREEVPLIWRRRWLLPLIWSRRLALSSWLMALIHQVGMGSFDGSCTIVGPRQHREISFRETSQTRSMLCWTAARQNAK